MTSKDKTKDRAPREAAMGPLVDRLKPGEAATVPCRLLKAHPDLSKTIVNREDSTCRGGCHKFTSSGVMYTVNTSSEAVADSSANETHLDIEALFRAHYGRVARIIVRVVGDRARSEDLAVEVFLKLWRNHKAQSENVEGWLYRVAVRAGLDELRRQTRRGHYERMLAWVQTRLPAATPEDIHSVSQKQARVRSVLSVLEPRQAQFLVLRSQDFTYQEVASILNMNPASIGTLVSRAEESFRKEYIKRYGQE